MNQTSSASGHPARLAALTLLQAVLDDRQTLDSAMLSGPYAALTGPDRSFAHALVGTTLRRLGTVDAVIAACVPKAPPTPARHILRLGVAQLLMLDTPAHAAVSTMVDLAKGGPARGQAGLINAVLRRIDRDRAAFLSIDAPEVPLWLLARWQRTYGPQTAEALARVGRQEPALDVMPRTAAAVEALRAHGGQALPTGGARFAAGTRVDDLPGFAEGAFWVQGAAASLPVQLLGPVAGAHVLDLCAAPGGKTMQLAAHGAEVTALDDNPQRMARLRDNLHRTGLSAHTVVTDAQRWRSDQRFDAVLLDAPCSATGVLRRKPDGAWIKQARDIASLAQMQRQMIATALAHLKPGGVLVYAVCSLEPEEGEQQRAWLLGQYRDMQPLAVSVPSAWGVTGDAPGQLRVLSTDWADRGGIDGFYIAAFKRAT